MSVLGSLIPLGYQIFYNPTGGLAVSGGSLYSYQAGTTTPQATYTDATLGTANSNPVTLDSSGGASIWFPVTTGYKFVLEDANGNVLWTRDQVYAIPPGAVGSQQVANGAIGTTQLASGSVTGGSSGILAISTVTNANIVAGTITGGNTGSIATGTIEEVNLDQDIDLSTLDRTIECIAMRTSDLSGSRIQVVPQFEWTSPVQLNAPGTTPGYAGNGVSFSPDGKFLAVAIGGSPYIMVYERSGTTFNYLGTPSTLPASNGNACRFSPNGDFLAVANNSSPYFTTYQRQGLNFTALGTPSSPPSAAGIDIAFSRNGEFLFVVPTGNNSTVTYNLSGTTQTAVSDGPDAGGTAGHIAIDPTSTYVAITGGEASLINIYSRAAKNFTSIGTPFSSPTCFSWNYAGNIFAAGNSGTPYFQPYSFSSGTFTALGTPSSMPSSAVNAIAWSPNGAYLAMALSSSPYLLIYSVSGTTFTAMAQPADIPGSEAISLDWSLDCQFLAVGVTSSPYFYVYQTGSATQPGDAILWIRNYVDV